jgi:hypothetical protein
MPQKWLYSAGISSSTKLHLPEFLCIGAQKAGTTWLCENLRKHPEIFIPRPQSTHYFDRDFHRSLEFYSDRFRPGISKVKGESCPAYAVLPRERIRAVRSLMPRVRILFLLRNPVERAWSHAVMRLVQRSGLRFEDVPESTFKEHFLSRRSRRRSDYLATLDSWLEFFPSEQIYVGFFDDIVEKPLDLLAGVFQHLGISENVNYGSFPSHEVINKGAGIAMPEQHRSMLRDIYRPEIDRLYERFGDRVAKWRSS